MKQTISPEPHTGHQGEGGECPVSAADIDLMKRIDKLHVEFPFAGSQMLRRLLAADGSKVGRHRCCRKRALRSAPNVIPLSDRSSTAEGTAMMRRRRRDQCNLFRLEDRIPKNHLLCRMNVFVPAALADLHNELERFFSDLARRSVDPESSSGCSSLATAMASARDVADG
jgi:hypothetical protein